jgi:hypothetical protein
MSPPIDGREDAESYNCLIGPVLREHDVLGTACLCSIAGVETVTPTQIGHCSILAERAEWDEESGQIALSVELEASPDVAGVRVVFCVSVLAATA